MLGEKETYKYLGILKCRNERKNKKRIPQENEKTTRNQTTKQKSHQRNYLTAPLVRYSGPFLK